MMETEAEAITAWNTRAPQAITVALADVLESVLSDEEVALSRPDYERAHAVLAAYQSSGL